jgi:hypothetical protein
MLCRALFQKKKRDKENLLSKLKLLSEVMGSVLAFSENGVWCHAAGDCWVSAVTVRSKLVACRYQSNSALFPIFQGWESATRI